MAAGHYLETFRMDIGPMTAKFSKGHPVHVTSMSGSEMGFLESADRMTLLPFGPNAR